MKYCPRCQETLSKDLFGKATKRYDGLSAYCLECMKKYRLEHYYSNKKPYIDRAKETRKDLRRYVIDLKSNPCSDCGIEYPNEPWLMEFNHREQSEKLTEISVLVRNGSANKLKQEIAKCDLLCVVCHRRFTAKQLGWVDSYLQLN